MSTQTIWNQNAALAATRDRVAAAELLLSLAVTEAVDLIRAGKPGYARFRLTRAGMAAERILGRSS